MSPRGHLGAHRNAVRQVVDDHRAEVRGQRKPSNDPRNNHAALCLVVLLLAFPPVLGSFFFC